MKARKFVFHLGLFIAFFAACGIDNGGWWFMGLIGGVALCFLSLMDLTPEQKEYIVGSIKEDEEKDFKF